MAANPGAEPTTPLPVETPTEEPQAEVETKDVEFWKGKAAAMEKEAKKEAKRRAELEENEKKRADAELSEMDKLKRQLAETEKKAADAERKAIRQRVAVDTGLPVVFADRLQGDDEEAMRADAAKLLEAIPKAEPKKTASINPTNPASATQTETLAQKKARLHMNDGAEIFDPDNVISGGGGIFIVGQ